MNLVLLFPEDFQDRPGIVRLAGRRMRHVQDVHRATVGDKLCVGLVNGLVGTGRVVRSDATAVEMEVVLQDEPPTALPLLLVLALPRPKVLRRVLRAASSLGVKRLVLLHCSRVEKSFWQTPFLAQEAMQHQLVLGLEQAKDTMLPEVMLRKQFKPFVEDELPQLIAGNTALVAHPCAAESCPRSVTGATTLIIGPEGGFIPYEIEKLESMGVRSFSLGPRILSVETAVPVIIARLF